MFNLGSLSIEMRALVERLFWAVCSKILHKVRELDYMPGGAGRPRGDALGHLFLQLLGLPVDAG